MMATQVARNAKTRQGRRMHVGVAASGADFYSFRPSFSLLLVAMASSLTQLPFSTNLALDRDKSKEIW